MVSVWGGGRASLTVLEDVPGGMHVESVEGSMRTLRHHARTGVVSPTPTIEVGEWKASQRLK